MEGLNQNVDSLHEAMGPLSRLANRLPGGRNGRQD
jgi:hypothetical protein